MNRSVKITDPELGVLEHCGSLAGKNVLVVENEWLIAVDLKRVLATEGAHVVGPVASVRQAFVLLGTTPKVDAAVLDIHLGKRSDVYPLAEALRRLAIPFIFATGYDGFAIRHDFADVPHLTKPFTPGSIGPVLAAVTAHESIAR